MTTKDRILDAGTTLFGRTGIHGIGMKQIVQESGAPFGSIYHFYPGGKTELCADVIRTSGEGYRLLFLAILDEAPDLLSGVDAFFDGAATVLEESGYADACPIATIALEVASTSEPLRIATAEVFESWVGAATERFTQAGIQQPRARRLAIEVIALLEGAFMLSRAARSTEAMSATRAAAVAAVSAALVEQS